MKLKELFELLKETYFHWDEDKAPRLGAALAYYTMFSLAPLLIIVIAICAFVFGDAAQGQITQQVQGTVGENAARAIEDMIKHTRSDGQGVIATLIGVGTLLFGALGVFVQLQDALNTIWKVTPKPGRGIVVMIKDRLFSFAMVLVIGFLLLVTLAISAGLEALKNYGTRFVDSSTLPGGVYLWQGVNGVVSFAFITMLFAMIYKILPDVKIPWKDVWVGAVVTALLFTAGKYLIGLYLGRASATSTFGAAGSLVVILVWVYYSSQILLFGAEFTRVYSLKYDSRVEPDSNAVFVTAEERARQGMPGKDEVQAAAQGTPSPRPA